MKRLLPFLILAAIAGVTLAGNIPQGSTVSLVFQGMDANGLPVSGLTIHPFYLRDGNYTPSAVAVECGKGRYRIPGDANLTSVLGPLTIDANHPLVAQTAENVYMVERATDANLADIGAMLALAAKEASVKAAEANAIAVVLTRALETSVKGAEANEIAVILTRALETSVKGGEANAIAVVLTRAMDSQVNDIYTSLNNPVYGLEGLDRSIRANDGNAWVRGRYLAGLLDANSVTRMNLILAKVVGNDANNIERLNLLLAAIRAEAAALDANSNTREARILAGVHAEGAAVDANANAREARLLAGVHSEGAALDANANSREGRITAKIHTEAAALDANTREAIARHDPNLADIGALVGTGGTGVDPNIYVNLAYLDVAVSSVAAETETGTNTINVIVLDANGNTAIQGAKVRMTVNLDTVLKTTGADGNVPFFRNNGSYVIAAACAGYDGNSVTKAVSADGSQIVKLNRVVIPAASSADQCACSLTVYGADGSVVAGKVITAMLKTIPSGSGVAYVGTSVSGTSNALGVVALNLWRTGVYELFSGGVKIGSDVTVNNAATMSLGNVKLK